MSLAIRVLLDLRPAAFGRGGIAVYAGELARALAAAFPADTWVWWEERWRRGSPAAPPAPAAPPNVRRMAGRVPSLLGAAAARLGWDVARRAGDADLVHWTDYVLPPPFRAPLVATVHDVLFETLPQCYTARMRAGLRSATLRLVRVARRLLVPSARTRDALVAHYGVDPERIDVVSHGVRPLPEAAAARFDRPFLLAVGTLEPRKNLARLLDAHARLGASAPRLVVAGARGWRDEALVRRLEASPGVTWEGEVGPARLAALYRGALALAYPSLGEGFGLPVLEAMAAGCPVLVAAGTACADLAGDAGLAVDARDIEALAAGLGRLLGDEALALRLGRAGAERAAGATWDAAARGTRACYARALAA